MRKFLLILSTVAALLTATGINSGIAEARPAHSTNHGHATKQPHAAKHAHPKRHAHSTVRAVLRATPSPTCQIRVAGKHGKRRTVKTFAGWQRRMVVTIPRVRSHGRAKHAVYFRCDSQVVKRVVPAGHKPVFKKLRVSFLALRPGEDNLRNFPDGSNVAAHPGPNEQLGGGRYPNSLIADIGLSKVGQNLYTPGSIDHGQCKQAVNDWIYQASGHTQSTAPGYYEAYASQGGMLLARDQAVKGDIIQTYSAADHGVGYHHGMHTMVVVSHTAGSNTFDVVDSNSVAEDVVGHHSYDPYAKAAQWGLTVAIWRMGDVDSPPAASPPSTPIQTSPTSPAGHAVTETAGSVAHTWTNYTNAGGSQGQGISRGQSVQIACKLAGFRVSDGNTWWYRIASSPWNSQYYVSADAFYNNGAKSGSLSGTPFVDNAVPTC